MPLGALADVEVGDVEMELVDKEKELVQQVDKKGKKDNEKDAQEELEQRVAKKEAHEESAQVQSEVKGSDAEQANMEQAGDGTAKADTKEKEKSGKKKKQQQATEARPRHAQAYHCTSPLHPAAQQAARRSPSPHRH